MRNNARLQSFNLYSAPKRCQIVLCMNTHPTGVQSSDYRLNLLSEYTIEMFGL